MPHTAQLYSKEAIHTGYWEWDMTGQKPFNNPELLEVLGYSGSYADPYTLWTASVVEEDLELARKKIAEHIQNGGRKPFILEARCRHIDGSVIYFLFTAYSEWDGDGNPKVMKGTFIDITPQKETQKELFLIKDFLSKTNEAALVGGWQLDMDSNKVTWTDVTKRIFGVPGNYEPTIDSPSEFFKPGYDRETLRDAFCDAVKNGTTYDLELRIINTAGKQLWTRTIGHPEFENGRCVRVYGIFQDINDRKENEDEMLRAKEAAEAAVFAKSKFLSVMSHEIRTPMNAVIGFTNLLLQNAREDQQEYLNVLKFSADNLMVILDDILDVSKIEAGKIDLEQIDFNLKDLLVNIHAAQQQAADDKEIVFRMNFDEQIPVMVKGDKVRVGQILNNLVNNAIKFTHDGEVLMTCKLITEKSTSVHLHFEVKDSGIGVPADKQEHIFDIFSQASSSTSRDYGGTGLGLAICKKLINLMGGQIKLISAPDQGALFHFDLKLPKGQLVKASSRKNDTTFSPELLKGCKLLLVEDNPINVLVARRFLEKWGIICEIAENGQIGLDMVQTTDYDVVLMDMQMPVMDGCAATKAIRALNGKYIKLPIIALTASVLIEMREKIIDCGMNDFISKPFKPEELFDKIMLYSGR